MSTLSRSPRVRKPVSRSIWLDPIPADTSRTHVRLTVGDQTFDYWLAPIPSDFGTGFRLEKFLASGGETYHVHIDPTGDHHTCECLGQLRWGHRHPCKHIAAVLALRQRNLI